MRAAVLAAALLLPAIAQGQSAPDDTLSGPPAVIAPNLPPDAKPEADQPPPKPLPMPTPDPPAPTWEKRGAATLLVLDKVDGRSATLSVPVGSRQVYRSLTLEVRSCLVRPATQAPDATALLVVQDSTDPAPRFTGWMLAAEPAASMMEHPIYDVRVLGCT